MTGIRVAAAAVLAAALVACKKSEPPPMVEANPPPPRGTTAWKIFNARTAAPPEVSANATIMDVMVGDTGITTKLVDGDNGWTCYPDDPATEANDPWCTDEEGLRWMEAWKAHRPPRLQGMAVAYAMQGSVSASDTDPFKLKPDSGKAWIVDPPGIAIAMPSARSYERIPTARRTDGPWIKYAGTPYAYIVIPTGH